MAEVTEIEAPVGAVVKLDTTATLDVEALALEMEASSIEPLIPSRGVFRLRSEHTAIYKSDGTVKLDGDAKKWLKDAVGKHDLVIWAEPDAQIDFEDDRFHAWRFHAWPQALPEQAEEAGVADQPAFVSLDLGAAHDYGTGDGVVIAVLDTGIDATHPLLTGRLGPGYDLIDDDADPADQANGLDDDGDGLADEAYGHGTFIAGIVAQVAPDALVQPIRVLNADGEAELYAVIEGIYLAIEMEVDVINMSFGLMGRRMSKSLDEALKQADKAGIVVVAAAGNAGGSEKHYPAAAKNVIAVTALGADGELLAPFSNHGKWVHVAAPGVGIVSAVPGGGYATWSGTSMATPVVSSLAAILTDYAPDRAGDKVSKAILDSARKMHHDERADKGIINVLGSIDKVD
jgi:subtilisin family serine protease